MSRISISVPAYLLALALVAAAAAFTAPSFAGRPVSFTAHSGLELAQDAATTWAPDARLVYVENDEPVAVDGTAERWGYLFYSPARGKARGYSVRNGKISDAADLGFDFDAPPISGDWLDSQAALRAADEKAGQKFCVEEAGRLSTMLLIRGAFHEKNPDAITWTLVYTSDTAPSLFVVVDAARGDVVKTWRG
jgi:hypothetical protein